MTLDVSLGAIQSILACAGLGAASKNAGSRSTGKTFATRRNPRRQSQRISATSARRIITASPRTHGHGSSLSRLLGMCSRVAVPPDDHDGGRSDVGTTASILSPTGTFVSRRTWDRLESAPRSPAATCEISESRGQSPTAPRASSSARENCPRVKDASCFTRIGNSPQVRPSFASGRSGTVNKVKSIP